ncbi:MAG TPA: Gfo/Idh/MocA family oxidoreductase, partial [Pirellulaceae bacterium]|nr:Gfo/Idh/MocA family oxidoreductase [Pirellulaceae bacterium]
MKVRIGIVGCGMIARFHARAMADVRGAELAGCASRSINSSETFAAEFDCRVFPRWQDLVADPTIDAISVCTPSGAHLEPAIAAARSGKHVLVEKPLEVTTARCDRIIAACRRHGVQLAAIFPSRFQACWQPIRRALQAGRFGRLALISGYVKWYRTQAYYDSGQWRGTWKLDGGGALM